MAKLKTYSKLLNRKMVMLSREIGSSGRDIWGHGELNKKIERWVAKWREGLPIKEVKPVKTWVGSNPYKDL